MDYGLWSKMSQTFKSRVKVSNMVKMFVSAYLLGKKLVPRENPPLTQFGALKMGEHLNHTDEPFFHIRHTFRINCYNLKLNIHFLQNFVFLYPVS